MPLPHYTYKRPGLDYLRKLKLITYCYYLDDYLVQVKKYNITSEDFFSIEAVKNKIREYNLSKIIESI